MPVVLRGFPGDGDIGRAVGIGNVFGAAVKKRVQLLLREQGVNVAFGGVKLLALLVEQIQRRAFISGLLGQRPHEPCTQVYHKHTAAGTLCVQQRQKAGDNLIPISILAGVGQKAGKPKPVLMSAVNAEPAVVLHGFQLP